MIVNLNYNFLALFLFSLPFAVFSQENVTKNIIVDSNTKKPLTNVNIYNHIDYTISNDDGRFVFYSAIDSIDISHIGYETLSTKFSSLKSKDTVFLKPQTFELDEVTISNKEPLIREVYRKVNENYPFFEFAEKAFLRCVVTKNGELFKFQDMLLDIKRNSLFSNTDIKSIDNKIQLTNLRKAGAVEKSRDVEDFEMYSMNDLLNAYSAIFTDTNNYRYSEEKFADSNYLKINFLKKESSNIAISSEGYYVIHKKDLAFKNVYYSAVYHKEIPFKEKRGFKWRTIASEVSINYKKNKKNSKYHISNGKVNYKVEVFNRGNKRFLYEASYDLLITESFIDKNFKSNFSSDKDLFKAKFDYDIAFWENQNQLLLDDRLIRFINGLEQLKGDYKIYSNFND